MGIIEKNSNFEELYSLNDYIKNIGFTGFIRRIGKPQFFLIFEELKWNLEIIKFPVSNTLNQINFGSFDLIIVYDETLRHLK